MNKIIKEIMHNNTQIDDPSEITDYLFNLYFNRKSENITFDDIRELQKMYINDISKQIIFSQWQEKLKLQQEIEQKKEKIIDPEIQSLLNEFSDVLQLKNYSHKTIEIYLSSIKKIHLWLKNKQKSSIEKINEHDAREFFLYAIKEEHLSLSSIRILRFSLQFFCNVMLKNAINLSFIESMRNERSLPMVLSRHEITQMIKTIDNFKHRIMTALLYSSGLRLSELVNLKIKDICLEELTIHVVRGKGKKDRITIFAETIREELRLLMMNKNGDNFLFSPFYNATRHISTRSVQKVIETAAQRAKLNRTVSPHDLRHAFATHLLENGISLRHIQMLLGHKSIQTTTIYTRVTNPSIKGVRSPLVSLY